MILYIRLVRCGKDANQIKPKRFLQQLRETLFGFGIDAVDSGHSLLHTFYLLRSSYVKRQNFLLVRLHKRKVTRIYAGHGSTALCGSPKRTPQRYGYKCVIRVPAAEMPYTAGA